MRLENKVAIITGDVTGIVPDCVEIFVKEGAFVVIADHHKEQGEKLADKYFNDVVYYNIDTSSSKEWKQLIRQVKSRYNALDILFNIVNTDDLKRSFDNDMENILLGCKYVIESLENTEGAIINTISTVKDDIKNLKALHFESMKADIRDYTKTIAYYCTQNRFPIRCNSINPKDELVTGLDIAYTAVFLASEESKLITGMDLKVKGGDISKYKILDEINRM